MKKINDELINKYVDNELTPEEIKELNYLLDTDKDALDKIKAAKFVESTISGSDWISAPGDVTSKIMSAINSNVKFVKNDSRFFKAIITIFGVLISSLMFFAFFALPGGKTEYTESIREFISKLSFDRFISVLQNDNFLVIGGGVVILLIFSVLLLMESHKNFKNKLNTYLH